MSNPYWNLNLGPAIFLAVGSMALLAPIAVWALLKLRCRRWFAFALIEVVLLLVNPLSQWIVFEPLNKHLVGRMAEQAALVGFKGRSSQEVRTMFGEPSFISGIEQAGQATWNYRRPWFYAMGSKFQAHFVDGKVVGWEAYDD